MTRKPLQKEDVERFLAHFGRRCRSGRLYITGGGSAVLRGWRASTLDIDIYMKPEPSGAFRAIRELKDELHVSVKLASPMDFVPAVPGWEARSPSIGRYGDVDVFHFDFYSQALAKIERFHDRDQHDVASMLGDGVIGAWRLAEIFDELEPELIRYPAVDPTRFRANLRAALNGYEEEQGG